MWEWSIPWTLDELPAVGLLSNVVENTMGSCPNRDSDVSRFSKRGVLMTVSLTAGTNIYIPVLTSQAFKIYCLPACRDLNLIHLQQAYHCQLIVTATELPVLTEELSQLKSWMRSKPSELDCEPVIERFERVERELPGLVATYGEAVIG